MAERRIVLLTGERQAGKSTVCRKLVDKLRSADYRVSGLLTRRTGYHDLEVTELHTSQVYPLTLPFDAQTDRILGNFIFSPEAIQRSTAALDTCFPAQVFFLDELGPLEFEHHQGWVNAITLLAKQDYSIAFVVVRPTLLMPAVKALPAAIYTVAHVKEENRDALPDSLFQMVGSLCCYA